MRWKKLGRIFCADNHHDWMKTHASNPVARCIQGDIYKIYFSTRDSKNRASIAYVVIDINNPHNILEISNTQVLTFGDLGLFDDMGVSMGCLTRINERMHLFYLGWNLTKTAPWHNAIGVAIENDEGAFQKHSKAPLLDRSDSDPYSLSYPFIVHDNGKYHMWYGSNLQWGEEQNTMSHVLKYASSKDGVAWNRDGRIAINLKDNHEYAISRPCVVKDFDKFRMWFSYRGMGSSYRIGYAESDNGVDWVRKDEEVGLHVEKRGWDSESISYPNVFDHKGTRYMLYNGNRYGATGFGLAVLEK